MKHLLMCVFAVFVLSGCAGRTANDAVGLHGVENIADQLTNRYRDTRVNCGKESQPAFLCSGVVLRGTAASTQFDFWNPSPAAVKRGGVSFSYLRADANFSTLVLGVSKGYIAYPVLQSPPGTSNGFDYVCAFPIDGATDHRADRGCGQYKADTDSRYCSLVGVKTAEDFYRHYMKIEDPSSRKFHQCSFDVRDSSNEAATYAFYQMSRAMAMIPRMALNDQNEMIVKTWAQNIPGELPIQALFYLEGNSAALRNVQHDQKRFETVAGKVLPIVSLKLPANQQGTAVFAYNPADQVVQ